jgi:phosphatidylglycerol---prolipoprotein diacylglyceryl transferase
MFPKFLSYGDFFLPTYGVLVAAGFLIGLWVTTRLARREKMNPEAITNLAVYCALSGLAGAKLLMFLFDIGYYLQHPAEIFSITTLRAGGIFYGGFIAALLVAYVYIKRQRLPGLRVADVFAPGLALGHGLGRLGCFAAGCCWGAACDRPWAVTFTDPDAYRLVGVPLGEPLHPTQLYEAAAEFIIFGLLYRRIQTDRRPGFVIGLYLVLYSAARFVVEFLRAHDQANPFGGPLSAMQWVALGLFAGGGWLIVRARRHQGESLVSTKNRSK